MYIRYFIEDDCWFVCKDESMICKKLYGGFSEDEAKLSLGIHNGRKQ